jgi:GH18 family chitinase
LGIGIDFVANANASWCGGLAQYAVNNGVGGIMEWVITEDGSQHNGQTPCLDAISPYVPAH